jgi:hypothetical protein
MTDIRFAEKGGQSVDESIICQRFFAAAPRRASNPTMQALFGTMRCTATPLHAS